MKSIPNSNINNLSRRKIIQSIGAVTATLAATPAVANLTTTNNGHGSHKAKVTHPYTLLLEAANDCEHTGNICLDHCITLVSNDDTSIADCLRTIRAMLPSLGALISLASSQNSNLPALAKVCINLCDECRIECEKHAHHHAQCKACMESCEVCIKECKKIAA